MARLQFINVQRPTLALPYYTTLLLLTPLLLTRRSSQYNVMQFAITLSLFVFSAWLLLVMPLQWPKSMNARSWTEHLLPAMAWGSALFISDPLVPKPPPMRYCLVGFCFLVWYLIWTVIYDLAGFTLNGRTYIYKGVDWTTSAESALISVVICLFALLLYFGNYYMVHKFTVQKRALLAALEFEMVQQVREQRSDELIMCARRHDFRT